MNRPYRALRHRDYRRLVLSQLFSLIGSQMQSVAINWHIYLITRSPLALGFVGLTRVVPVIVFSLWGGVVADRYDRRRIMIITQLSMTAVAVALAVLTFSGKETLWALYTLNFLSAAAGTFDNPARNSLLPRLVPPEELPGALSLNFSAFQTAMIGGPAIAGLILAGHAAAPGAIPGAAPAGTTISTNTGGLTLIYVLNAVSFLAVIWALATMRASGAPEPGAGDAHPWEALKEGLRFVFTTPLMVWTMGLDFIATFLSGSMTLLPIFADVILKVGAKGYGLLVAAPAIGALAGSIFVSIRPLPSRQGHIFLWSVAAYGAATVLFGFSRSFGLTLAALAAVGLADAISTVIRQTLRQVITPDRLRGRMTSVNAIFFLGGPQLGELEAGFVASLFASTAAGVTFAVVSGGFLTIAAVAAVAILAAGLRRYDFHDYVATAPPFPIKEPTPGRAGTPVQQ
ncbi:MAG TPA: MFS transporter [Thermoanaerobaculia bacterium]|nr:MFS transporter [Thermoanaerobaculia bacterium]